MEPQPTIAILVHHRYAEIQKYKNKPIELVARRKHGTRFRAQGDLPEIGHSQMDNYIPELLSLPESIIKDTPYNDVGGAGFWRLRSTQLA